MVPFSVTDPGWGVKDFIDPCHHKGEILKKTLNAFPSGFFTNGGPGQLDLELSGSLTFEPTNKKCDKVEAYRFTEDLG